MRIGKFIFLALLLSVSFTNISAQDYNIGIRAGLNFGKYLGPQIPDVEKYSISNGFHFGINFSYNFTEFLALRGEILYNQNGTKYKYEGDGWYYFILAQELVRDKTSLNLDISSGGVALPISVHIKTLEKFEFFAGGYVNFIFSSLGTGKWIFGPDDEFLEHSFEQGQYHNYRSDDVGEFNNFAAPINLRANGTTTQVQSLVGGYYLHRADNGSRIRSLDYGFLAGFSYYLNRGLYLSLRGDLGMRDMTNNAVDYSYAEINDDGSYVFSTDFDRNFTVALSLGFKF